MTVALGESATCTIVNDDNPATLTLVKHLVTDDGGTAAATDWTLTATGPTAGVSGPSGDPAVTGASVAAGRLRPVRVGPARATRRRPWSCVGGSLAGSTVTLGAIGPANATCTIVNDDVPATLTLVKQVENDNAGTTVATDWTLTATGPTAGVSGAVGDPEVTAVLVDAGLYTLSESGPSGYAASAWVCAGRTQPDGTSVSLDLGETATCTITNDDIPAALSIVKSTTATQIVPGSTVPCTRSP